MKRYLRRLRLAQFNFLMCLLRRDYQEALDVSLKTRVVALASEVSMNLLMQYLDKEKLLHCEVCAQRFGLRRVNGKLYCPKHEQKAMEAVAA